MRARPVAPESAYHLFELEDWETASKILLIRLNTPTHEEFHNQLKTWGYYAEQNKLYQGLLDKLGLDWDSTCLNGLANIKTALGDYEGAIALQKQHAQVVTHAKDDASKAYALGNIGLNYYYLSQYEQAIEHLKNSIALLRQLQDPRAEQMFLGNLGLEYYGLGQYQQAVDCHQRALALARAGQNRREGCMSISSLTTSLANQ